MADKTTVTKGSVSESENGSSSIPSGEGQIPSKELENQIRENLRGEYSRESVELKEKLADAEERLADLDEKVRLTEAEKREKSRLENRTDELGQKLQELDTSPQYEAYREDQKRKAEKIKSEAEEAALTRFYKESVDDYIAEASEVEKLGEKDLRKELNLLMQANPKSMEMNPLRRVKFLMQKYKDNIALEKKAEERRKELEADSRFSEGNGRNSREKTLEESKKDGDIISQMKAMGKY